MPSLAGFWLAGAGSPDNLARRPIRVLLADEVDKYPITREGDPIAWRKSEPRHLALTGFLCGLVRRRLKMKAGLLTVTKIQIGGGLL